MRILAGMVSFVIVIVIVIADIYYSHVHSFHFSAGDWWMRILAGMVSFAIVTVVVIAVIYYSHILSFHFSVGDWWMRILAGMVGIVVLFGFCVCAAIQWEKHRVAQSIRRRGELKIDNVKLPLSSPFPLFLAPKRTQTHTHSN